MSKTKIEWCDQTRPFVYGCSKCSPGCDNCYAERRASMLAAHPNHKISTKYACVVDGDGEWTGDIELGPLDFTKMIRARKPQRVFVNSMSDTFHPGVPSKFLKDLWTGMRFAHQHTFLILTKRHERMLSFLSSNQSQPLPNVWLGVTVCNQAEADAKIPLLLQTPAAKRFVSVEPMLGPMEIGKYLFGSYECGLSCGKRLPASELPELQCTKCGFDGPDTYETWGDGNSPDCGHYMVREHPDTPYLDWVICGGETGPKARPMHPDWARSLRDQCVAAGVPYFFKGWGEWQPREWKYDGATHAVRADSGILHKFAHSPTSQDRAEHASEGWQALAKVGKKRAGRLLDGREWNEAPA